MADDFVWLADLLSNWPARLERPNLTIGCQLRLADAIDDLGNTERVGESDLAALVRQVMRRQAMTGGGDPWLRVPGDPLWPSDIRWRSHGLVPTTGFDGGYALRSEPWCPAWLMQPGDPPPAEAAEAESIRQEKASTQLGDGFLQAVIGQSSYTSPGQQQAMRTVLASQPTATIVVNLPTGSGKSAVFTVPAYLWGERGGVTVVVVPTTALALDQERGVRASLARGVGDLELPAHLAFHSALTEDERKDIYTGIRAGTQTVVFTSPEGLTGALSPSLYGCARAGHLRAIAIDEAHLVAQWGADFRPDFQAAAGLRTELLKTARDAGHEGFRTILLTGTLTEEVLEALMALFGRPGPLEVVSSVSLRCEPSYWLKRCNDEDEREQFLLESIRHLPRPLLLYTTRVDHAYQWADVLRSKGYRRVAVVTGASTTGDRQRAIEGLTGRNMISGARIGTAFDIVVATSAFGLGIDQPDVRSVVHACVPETVDRYYQEVGRGGRDGHACVSLLLYTDEDFRAARSLNRTRIISIDRGFERWEAMRTSATMVGDDVMRVSLTAKPLDLVRDSEHNEDWNLRTLTLMSRAQMIELQSEAPPPRSTNADGEGELTLLASTAVIRVLHGHLADRSSWEAEVGESRRRTHKADEDSLRLMQEAIRGEVDLAEVFQAAYTIDIPARGQINPRVSVIPQRSCGGCPHCRRLNRKVYQGAEPRPEPVLHPHQTEDDILRSIFADGDARLVLLSYSAEAHPTERAWLELCERLAQSLTRHGVRNIVAPRIVLSRPSILELYRRVPDGFVFSFDQYRPYELPDLPTLIIHPRMPADRIMPMTYLLNAPGVPRRAVLISEDIMDPEHPALAAVLLRQPSLQADRVLERL